MTWRASSSGYGTGCAGTQCAPAAAIATGSWPRWRTRSNPKPTRTWRRGCARRLRPSTCGWGWSATGESGRRGPPDLATLHGPRMGPHRRTGSAVAWLAAALALGLAATVALAGVTVYKNNFSSKVEAKELRHSSGKHCAKRWREKAKTVRAQRNG